MNNIMKKKYWFRPKSYGYGIIPISWEGWLTSLIFILLIVSFGYIHNLFPLRQIKIWDPIWFILEMSVISILLIHLMKNKTKGKIKWYWGSYKKIKK